MWLTKSLQSFPSSADCVTSVQKQGVASETGTNKPQGQQKTKAKLQQNMNILVVFSNTQ